MADKPMAYFPASVTCAKCDKLLTIPTNLRRVHDAKTKKRYLEAACHGEVARIGFASSPNATVRVFEA